MRVKIAHLTSVHPPFDTRIFHKECKTLAAAGYEVVLVVPHDQDEERDGVRLHAVPKPVGRAQRARQTIWQVYQAALQEDAALYHFHDPELIPVGMLLKLRGKRVIYDVHEDVPEDVLTKDYIPAPIRWTVATAAGLAERLGAAVFDGVVAVTPSIAARFPSHKTRMVQNFPMLAELAAIEPIPYAQRPPSVAYVGMVNSVRGGQEMIDALALLPDEARLTLAGNFTPPALEAELRARPGWSHVDFKGWQARTEIAQLLSNARLGLVLFHPLGNHVAAQPNKLFEYMAAGLPVVASDFPRWRELVDGTRCGLLVNPLDPRAIADAIAWLLDHPQEAEAMGQRGAEAVRTRFHWGPEGETLVDLTRSLVS